MRSRHRSLSIPALILVAALVVAGCGSGGGTITASGEPQSVSGSDSSGGTDDGTGGSSGTEDGGSGSEDTAQLDLPDISELPAGSEACMALGLAIATTAAGAIGMGSEADIQQMQQEFEQYRSQVPAELQDDLAVLEDAFATVAEDGIFAGGEAMSSPEFEAAQANIEAYLNDNCGGLGN